MESHKAICACLLQAPPIIPITLATLTLKDIPSRHIPITRSYHTFLPHIPIIRTFTLHCAELVVELAESLCTHILSSLQTALPKCATSLLTALARLVEATEDTLAPQLADIVGTVLPFLRVAPTSDYMTRKTAAETLNVLCTHVGDAVLPFRATIVERLEDAKCDRIKQVRDAAASAQCEYYALGSTAAAPLGAPPRHAPPAVPRVRDDSPETPPDDQPSVSASHKRRRAPHDVPVTICVPPKKERAEPCAAEKENAGYVPHTPSRVLADITHVVGTATAQDHAVQDRAVQPSGTSPEQEEVGCCGLGRHTDAHETDGVCAADALQPEQAQARLQSQLHDLKQQCAEKERLLQVLKATSPHKTPSHTPHKTAHTTPCRTPVAAHKEDVPKGDGLAPIRQYDSSLTFPVGERIDAVERRIGALEQGTDTTVTELHKLRENVAALAAAVAAMHETCEKLAARQGAPSASVPAPSASSVSAPVFRTPARAAPPHTLETPYFARGGAGSLDWREVRQRCVTGDYGFAFGRVLAGEPADIDQTLSYLMRKTGAVADRLPEDTTAEVFRCVARWLAERHAVDVCLQWAEQETERTSHRFASAALVQDVCDGLDAIGTENGADGTRARGIAKKLRKKYQTALC